MAQETPLPSFSSSARAGPLSAAVLKTLPKIDLHRHLEGSLRLETLVEIARKYDLDVPAEPDVLRPHVQMLDDDPTPSNFLSKFAVLRRFYCAPEVIGRLAYEAVVDAARDNVCYLELRFSPQALASQVDFPLDEVMEWVIAGTRQASEEAAIDVGLVVSLVRHEPVAIGRQVAEIAFDHFTSHNGASRIVGLDLAGDELNHPAEDFGDLFQEARRIGMGITVHAGEWSGPETVRTAVEKLGAARIGHGVRAVESEDVLQIVRERGVTLEVCLISNLQSGVVYDLRDHPLSQLLAAGVRATLNTDDPAVSDSSLTQEYEASVRLLGLRNDDLRQMNLNAAEAAFLSEEKRRDLVRRFRQLWPPDL
ncbi:MAG: adenosine deaminase [Candidatus Promineifilaceae bacterium]|nr:adenosine deaminase [Candidatus Promineifilaceae bacterium]